MKAYLIGHNGKGRGSRIITWATRGDISHTSMRFVDVPVEIRNSVSRQLNIRLESDHEIESIQSKGVHEQPFIASGNQYWYDFEQTEEQARAILYFMLAEVGKDYDWRGIISFASRRDKQNPNKWFCSELTSAAMKHAGIPVMNMPTSWIQPNIHCASPIFKQIRAPALT